MNETNIKIVKQQKNPKVKKKKEKRYSEFSKILLIQESVLIWIITIAFIGLAYLSIFLGYLGSLPWLTAMVSLPWGAYGVSQAFYYKKSQAENTKNGVKYESVIHTLNTKNVAASSTKPSSGDFPI